MGEHLPQPQPPKHPRPPSRPALPEPPARADLRRVQWLAGGVLLAWLLGLCVRPVPVTVEGQRLMLRRGMTAAEAAREAGYSLQPGDLVDVAGLVLRPGAGCPARLYRNGRLIPPDARLGRGDCLAVVPGLAVLEPHSERARLLTGRAPGHVRAGVSGVRRTVEGQYSGKQIVSNTPAVATIPLATQGTRRLALTFDDGPWPSSTAAILDILQRHQAHATFFVLGSLANARPQLVRRAVTQGCEIGIHSWAHTSFHKLSDSGLRADLARCEATLRPLLGRPAQYVRPPYGATSRRIAATIRACGYKQVLWSVDTNDWRRPGANTIAYRILAHAGDGAVVLCHDGGGPRDGTVAALARVVPQLQARGFRLVTLTELYSHERGPSGGALILADGRRLEITPSVEGLVVMVDGQPAVLPEAPVEVAQHLALPVHPVLDLLHVKAEWNETAQTLVLDGPGERLLLRINSLTVETRAGQTHTTVAPPVLYRNRALVPLPLILEASGASASYDPQARMLKIISPAGLLRTGKLGWPHGRGWAQHQPWTVQYADPLPLSE